MQVRQSAGNRIKDHRPVILATPRPPIRRNVPAELWEALANRDGDLVLIAIWKRIKEKIA